VGAGVILLVISALVGIFSLFALFAGAIMGQMSGIYRDSGLTDEQVRIAMGLGRVVILAFGGIGLALALAHLLSGIGVLRRRGWARILGLVLSVLGVVIWGVALVGSIVAAVQPIPAGYLESSGLTIEEYRSFARIGSVVGLVITTVALAAYLFILVVLARRGREFA
jgi:tellurite resistance protein TehA-like permease